MAVSRPRSRKICVADFVSSSMRGNRAVGEPFCLPGRWGEDSDRNWTGHAAPNAGMSFRFLGVNKSADVPNIFILRCVKLPAMQDGRCVVKRVDLDGWLRENWHISEP